MEVRMYTATRLGTRVRQPLRSLRWLGWAMLVGCVFSIPTKASSQPRPDSSGFIASGDGARLYYAIYGKGRDTVVVPAGVLLALYLSPLREDVTVVFYDPRGRGQSDWVPDANRLTMADEVRDLEAIRSGSSPRAGNGRTGWS